MPNAIREGNKAPTLRLYKCHPIKMAMMISMLIGKIVVGTATNNPAIAIAKTASISQISNSTKIRNITRVRELITFPVISAIDRPFSRTLVTNAPKSWTAPINIVPNMIQSSAGSHPQ